MKDIKNIENFLEGNMNPSELAEFKSAMNADPSLQNMVDLQKDTMNGIKEHRKLELKTRLSNIHVSPGLSLGQKILVSGAAALFLISGVAIYSNVSENNTTPIVAENTANEVDLFEAPLTTTPDEIEEELLGISNTESEEILTSETINETALTETSTSNNNESSETNVFESPNDEDFNLGDSDFNPTYDNEDQGDISSNGDNSADIKGATPTFKEPHAHKLSYNWNNDNLTLFGKFDKSEPYLLIDLADSKELYLKYQGDFYKLIESTSERKKSSLLDSKVSDPFLISDLIKKSK